MATHRGNDTNQNGDVKDGVKDGVKDTEEAPTSELVYMALLPEKRGKGLGKTASKPGTFRTDITFINPS